MGWYYNELGSKKWLQQCSGYISRTYNYAKPRFVYEFEVNLINYKFVHSYSFNYFIEFTDLHEDILIMGLKQLEKQNKAEIISMGDTAGVKFFD